MTNDNTAAVNTSADAAQIFDALEAWIKQKPGLDPANYGLAPGQTPDWKMRLDLQRSYQTEMRSIAADRKRAMKALDEARNLQPARLDVLLDSFRAFSGRLKWEVKYQQCRYCGHRPDIDKLAACEAPHQAHELESIGQLDYATGQYWPTEYRKAAASVLESYVAGWLQAEAVANPQTFTYRTMADVEAANRSIGNHWFDRETMRFFKTRIETGLVAGKRFVTSEKGPDGVRKYSIREAQPDGTIDTVGDFQEFRTLNQARAAILREKK